MLEEEREGPFFICHQPNTDALEERKKKKEGGQLVFSTEWPEWWGLGKEKREELVNGGQLGRPAIKKKKKREERGEA